MRISSQQVFNSGVNRLQDQGASLQKTQEQVSTGKKVNRPSDDPVAAARILKLNQEKAQIDQYQRNVDLAENRLQQEESTLGDMNDLLERVRELTVQAGNGSLTQADRQSIAAELRQRLDQMASLANTRDASGEYIFSGFKGGTQAFARNISGDWVYQGDEGERSLEVDTGVRSTISDHGKELFVDVPSAQPTFFAEASETNSSGGRISTGMVLDQELFNEYYESDRTDLVVDVFEDGAGDLQYGIRSRNDPAPEPPTAADYTESAAYTSGGSITFEGLQFEISDAVDGDRFFLKTSEKQGMFTSIEKLAYGLENQTKGPAVATVPATGFTPAAGDTLLVNGVGFSPGVGDTVEDLRDAIQAADDPALEGVTADIVNGDLKITSKNEDLTIEAAPWTGDLEIQGAKEDNIVVTAGAGNARASFASGQQAFNELVDNSLVNLDNARETILQTQTEIGGRLNSLESTRGFLDDSSVYTEDILSKIRDVDYAEAISQLSFQSFVLQASQQSFAQISRLSLFDRL